MDFEAKLGGKLVPKSAQEGSKTMFKKEQKNSSKKVTQVSARLCEVVQDGGERYPWMVITLDLDKRRQRQVTLSTPVRNHPQGPGPAYSLGARIQVPGFHDWQVSAAGAME